MPPCVSFLNFIEYILKMELISHVIAHWSLLIAHMQASLVDTLHIHCSCFSQRVIDLTIPNLYLYNIYVRSSCGWDPQVTTQMAKPPSQNLDNACTKYKSMMAFRLNSVKLKHPHYLTCVAYSRMSIMHIVTYYSPSSN